MKTILLIHGPNLNKLGLRDKSIYGTVTLQEIELAVKKKAEELGFDIIALQSNHEGAIIDMIQAHSEKSHAMIINPGAYTHYSYAIHDAILDSQLPAIEVHLSNIDAREPWRAHSVTAPACILSIIGKKLQGYIEALEYIAEHYHAY